MKQIKLFGVLAIALSLGLAACGGGGNNGPEPCTKHDWGEKVTIKEPTCTEPGQSQRTCKVCGEKEEPKTIKALGHAWADDETGAVAPTCTEAGSKNQHCTRCDAKQTVEVPALGHDWVDDETGGVAPTCTEAGSKNQHCSRCDATQQGIEVPALGHEYGDWVMVEGKEPTCDKAGLEKHVCTRCGAEETREAAALGHDLELVGGEQEAPSGEATVRVYKCKRCGETYLGFKADEPSAASLPHLMVGDNGGMRFFGRPIGNSLALTNTGKSEHEENNECIYCSTETGDFFEYIFTLTDAQAELLSTCRLYCDARPADHLSGDFWAYGRSATDWTPGYYIDGAPEHIQYNDDGTVKMVKDHARCVDASPTDRTQAEGAELETEVPMGARIEDYRYVLYVDDVIQEFDADTAVPAEGSSTNMVRKEYVLPFTFHLHKGQNKISLRMAGGYRSEFYNFIFRPYVEPTPVTVKANALEIREGKTAQIESDMEGLTYVSSSTSVATVDSTGLVTGVKAGKATITVSKEGNYKDAKVEVTVLEKEGNITIDLNGENNHVVAPEGSVDVYYSSYNNATRLRNWQKDGSITYTFQSELAGAFNIQLSGSQSGNMAETLAVKVNGAAVAVSGELAGSTYSPVDAIIGVAELQVGENTIEIKNLAESSQLTINAIKLFPHAHEWAAATAPVEGDNDAVVERYECAACGMVKYVIAAKTAKMALASGSAWKTDPTTSSDGAFKLNKDGHSASFTFALPKAFEGKMYQTCYMDSYNANKTKKLFYQTNNHPSIEVTIGEGDNAAIVDLSQYANTTFQQVFGDELNGSNSVTKDVELGNVSLATANKISYKRVETLNMLVTHFVFIGREAA